MGVCRQGYYAWCNRKPSNRTIANASLLELIRATYKKSSKTYGSPRIYQELRASGVRCSEKRVAQIMQRNEIRAGRARRYVVTTDSNHNLPTADNLLDRKFTVDQANTHWSGDITYIWTREGWLYLAVVLDLFSRKVVGWSMNSTMDRKLVIAALDMAIANRHPSKGLLCHSDRGSQYASGDYQNRLSEAGFICSMSRRANCWDNAPIESFFASLKKELIYATKFHSHAEARAAIFKWIEIWCNHNRRHSALGYISPDAYEQNQESIRPLAKVA